jgi:hypothetical protein
MVTFIHDIQVASWLGYLYCKELNDSINFLF